MVKTLISLISNIKVKGSRGEIKPHKNTSRDKKKGLYSEKGHEARDVGNDVSKHACTHARLNSKLQKCKLEKVSSD